MLLLVLVQIGVSIIIHKPMRSSRSMAFELFISDFWQKKILPPHNETTSCCWKRFLRYINTTKKDWKWCSSSGGSQYSRRINSFTGSGCGGSAICGQTVWGFGERQDCWSLWHKQQTTTSLRLPECLEDFFVSNLVLFHQVLFFRCMATCTKTCFHESSSQLNQSVAHHHRLLHAVNPVHAANPQLLLKL